MAHANRGNCPGGARLCRRPYYRAGGAGSDRAYLPRRALRRSDAMDRDQRIRVDGGRDRGDRAQTASTASAEAPGGPAGAPAGRQAATRRQTPPVKLRGKKLSLRWQLRPMSHNTKIMVPYYVLRTLCRQARRLGKRDPCGSREADAHRAGGRAVDLHHAVLFGPSLSPTRRARREGRHGRGPRDRVAPVARLAKDENFWGRVSARLGRCDTATD